MCNSGRAEGRYHSPTGRCARAIRATAEASHRLCTSIAAGWTPAASAGWLSLVSFACIQFLHVRPRRRSPYSPREHAGATGFLLNETSPFSPTVPSCYLVRCARPVPLSTRRSDNCAVVISDPDELHENSFVESRWTLRLRGPLQKRPWPALVSVGRLEVLYEHWSTASSFDTTSRGRRASLLNPLVGVRFPGCASTADERPSASFQ